MKRLLLPPALATALSLCLLGCTAQGPALLRSATPAATVSQTSLRPHTIQGECDIAIDDHFVRTTLRAVYAGDSTAVACIDEIGVTLVMATISPRKLHIRRWFPPLRARHAEQVALAAAAMGHAIRLDQAESGVYALPLSDTWEGAIVKREPGIDSLLFLEERRVRFRGAVTESTLVVTSAKGELVLAFRRKR